MAKARRGADARRRGAASAGVGSPSSDGPGRARSGRRRRSRCRPRAGRDDRRGADPEDPPDGCDERGERQAVHRARPDPHDPVPGGMILPLGRARHQAGQHRDLMAAPDEGGRDAICPRVELAGRGQDDHGPLADRAELVLRRAGTPQARADSSHSTMRPVAPAGARSRSAARRSASAGASAGGASRASSRRGARPIEPHDHHPALGFGDGLDPLGRPAQDQARDAEPGGLALDAARIGEHGRRVELEGERGPVALRLDDLHAGPEDDPGGVERRPRARDAGRARPAARPRRRARIAAQAAHRRRARGSPPGGSSRRRSRPAGAPARRAAGRPPRARRPRRGPRRSPGRRGPASGRRRARRPRRSPPPPGWRRRSGSGRSSQRERWSATTRLSSSGIRRSKLRRPASTWATGMPSLAAPSAPASVEFVSPYTSTASGRSATRTGSRAMSIRPVCSPWSAAADAEAVVGPGEAELGEERAGHRLVPVLARVDEDLVVAGAERGLERGRLDELGSCPDDAHDPHGAWRRPLRPADGRSANAGPGHPSVGGRDAHPVIGHAGRQVHGRAGCCGRRRGRPGPGTRRSSSARNSGSAVWVTIARNGPPAPQR